MSATRSADGIRVHEGFELLVPFLHRSFSPLGPLPAGGGGSGVGRLGELPQADLRVPHDGGLERVVPPELLGVDIELDDRRPYPGEPPAIRHLAAGLAPDEENEVGIKHRPVRGLAGIYADDAHRERMVRRYGVLGVEGGSDGDGKFLGEFHKLRPRPRSANTASRDDDGILRRPQEPCRLLNTPRLGLGPESGHLGSGLVHENLEVSLRVVGQLPPSSHELQMDRSRSSRGGDPEGLSKQVGVPLDMLHPDVEFRDRFENREVFDFLVDISIVGLGVGSTRDGYHGRAPEIGVPKTRGEVGRPHRLGHAYPGAAAGACVAIRHVNRRLFSVGQDTLDIRPLIHFEKGAFNNSWHKEDMTYTVGLERFSKKTRTCHFGHIFSSSKQKPRVVKYETETYRIVLCNSIA